VEIFNIVLSSSILFVISNSVKLSFLKKLQIKKILVKKEIRKTLLLLFFSISIENIYNIAIAKKFSNCLDNLFNLQITKATKRDI